VGITGETYRIQYYFGRLETIGYRHDLPEFDAAVRLYSIARICALNEV